MSSFFLKIVLLPLVCLLLYDQAAATLTAQEVAVTPQGIHMQLHERALSEVLSHIQQTSGIRFSFPHSMRATPITASIHAPDWPSAVRELLRPFSTAEVWDKRQLNRVYILERGTAASISQEPAGASESESEKLEDPDAPAPPSAASLPLPPPVPPPPPFQPDQ